MDHGRGKLQMKAFEIPKHRKRWQLANFAVFRMLMLISTIFRSLPSTIGFPQTIPKPRFPPSFVSLGYSIVPTTKTDTLSPLTFSTTSAISSNSCPSFGFHLLTAACLRLSRISSLSLLDEDHNEALHSHSASGGCNRSSRRCHRPRPARCYLVSQRNFVSHFHLTFKSCLRIDEITPCTSFAREQSSKGKTHIFSPFLGLGLLRCVANLLARQFHSLPGCRSYHSHRDSHSEPNSD